MKYLVARMTARRALKTLELQGLVRTESGRGYRVLSRGNDPTAGCAIAFTIAQQDPKSDWTDFNLLLLKGLQHAAKHRGWPVLGVGAAGQKAEHILDQCANGRAWGLIADTCDPELLRLAARSGLPVVIVDAWEPIGDVDMVIQNGFLGGTQAVEYLVGAGHRRIAWYGQVNDSAHAAARFGGAYTALGQHGLELPGDFKIDAQNPEAAAQLGRLLDRPDRPTAILALWGPHLREAVEGVRKAGLELGRDIELVGWSPAESYDQSVASQFRGERVPPVVEWSVADMAEMAIDRLASRREHPHHPPVTVNIQTRIRPAAESLAGALGGR